MVLFLNILSDPVDHFLESEGLSSGTEQGCATFGGDNPAGNGRNAARDGDRSSQQPPPNLPHFPKNGK
jgi:hypothetical protein